MLMAACAARVSVGKQGKHIKFEGKYIPDVSPLSLSLSVSSRSSPTTLQKKSKICEESSLCLCVNGMLKGLHCCSFFCPISLSRARRSIGQRPNPVDGAKGNAEIHVPRPIAVLLLLMVNSSSLSPTYFRNVAPSWRRSGCSHGLMG